MQFILSIGFVFIFLGAAGQHPKPEIVGQKDLSTPQGESITIQLTDLYVNESDIENNDGGNHDDDDSADEDGNNSDEETTDDHEGESGNSHDDEHNDDGAVDGDDDGEGGHTEDDANDEDRDEKDNGNNVGSGNNGNGNNGDQGDKKNKDKGKGSDKNDSNDKDKGKGTDKDKGKTNDKDKGKGKGEGKNGNGNDRTNAYPHGYTLEVLDGKNYDVTGTTITPDPDFTGVLLADVRVKNAVHASPKYALKITVTPDNTASANKSPVITGQMPLQVSKNQSVNIVLAHLLVTDPDNDYPADFSMEVFPGDNYSLDGNKITPAVDFTGDLTVKVAVHDGLARSNIYPLKITVLAGQNHKPLITGQEGIKIPEGDSLLIELAHLAVDDPDNRYPDDFTLQVLEGEHYAVSHHVITPAVGFVGTLTVELTVHDGKVSSDPYGLKVQVVPKDRLEIIGQRSLEVPEDSVVQIGLSDLEVIDPTNTYPSGFTLQIMKGENYSATNGWVEPGRNFYGNLTVPVTISRDGSTSDPFSVLVTVEPVNDPPELLYIETDPLLVIGSGPWPVSQHIEVVDVDDDYMLFAEIGFDRESFMPGIDELVFEAAEDIHSVYDKESGVLFMVGRATREEYQALLRSVSYQYHKSADSLRLSGSLKVYLKISDGRETSTVYERVLLVENNLSLEIPAAFTPNNDQANDTWKIGPIQPVGKMNTFVRVYDKRGNIVFESADLETEWDGYLNGAPLPADVYFYTIEMDLAYRKVHYKGIVSLLR